MLQVEMYSFGDLMSSTNIVDTISPLKLLTFSPNLIQLLYPLIYSDWLPTYKAKRSSRIDKAFLQTVNGQ
jgi:hypothetical protein